MDMTEVIVIAEVNPVVLVRFGAVGLDYAPEGGRSRREFGGRWAFCRVACPRRRGHGPARWALGCIPCPRRPGHATQGTPCRPHESRGVSMALIHSLARWYAGFLKVVAGISFLMSPPLAEAEELPACRKRLTVDCGTWEVRTVAFSSGGARVAIASDDGAVRIRDATTGALLRESLDTGGKPQSLAFSPDGSTLAVGLVREHADAARVGHNPRNCWGVVLLDLPSGLRRSEFWGENREGRHVRWLADGKALVMSRLRGLTCWDVTSGRRTDIMHPGAGAVDCIAASAAGDHLAFIDSYQNLYMYNQITCEFLTARGIHRRRATTLAFSRDASLLASGSLDHEVKIWETSKGKESAAFHAGSAQGCWDRVLDIHLSQDDHRLLSAHMDRSVRIWNPIQPGLLATRGLPLTSKVEVTSMAFSPDGKSLGAVGFVRQVGTRAGLPPTWEISVWDVPPSP